MSEWQPLVSIVTPSYNQGQFIEETILSVKNQDYGNIEHIVVDGGSTDNTLGILKKYENSYDLHWVSEPDEGQADAINKGFRMARGDIIGWLNSDDVYFTRNVIDQVVNRFLEYPDIDLIHGNRITIDESNGLLGLHYSRKFSYDKFLKGFCTFYQQTVFFRRLIADEYQIDSNLQLAMDTDFWLKMQYPPLARFGGEATVPHSVWDHVSYPIRLNEWLCGLPGHYTGHLHQDDPRLVTEA